MLKRSFVVTLFFFWMIQAVHAMENAPKLESPLAKKSLVGWLATFIWHQEVQTNISTETVPVSEQQVQQAAVSKMPSRQRMSDEQEAALSKLYFEVPGGRPVTPDWDKKDDRTLLKISFECCGTPCGGINGK